MTYHEIDICEHKGMISGLVHWCNLKDENGKQVHPEMKCKDCPDFKPTCYWEETTETT